MSYTDFETNGYKIIKSKQILLIKKKIKEQIVNIVCHLLKRQKIPYSKFKEFDEMLSFCFELEKKKKATILKSLYEIFSSIPIFYEISNLNFFLHTCKKLKIKYPVHGTGPTLRIDRPLDKKFITNKHQDYFFSFLSPNAITFWFNLTSVKKEDGPLIIYNKSHKYGVMKNYSKNFMSKFKKREIILKENEVLVFNQFLIHQSGVNISKKPRLSIGLRYNDLYTLNSLSSSFKYSLSDYVIKKQTELN